MHLCFANVCNEKGFFPIYNQCWVLIVQMTDLPIKHLLFKASTDSISKTPKEVLLYVYAVRLEEPTSQG
jgi:hypothetical protein